jgi:hypothetical protein
MILAARERGVRGRKFLQARIEARISAEIEPAYARLDAKLQASFSSPHRAG